MMVVFSPEDIDVKSNASCHCKRMEDMGDHLCREVSDLLAFQSELSDTIRTRADVNYSSGKCL